MKLLAKPGICLLILCLAQGPSIAQDGVFGKWTTIDDETGDPKSVVDIYEKDGQVFGKIVKLFRKPGEDPDPICDDCEEDDPRRNKKIIGMDILLSMKKDGDEYAGGTILDPKIGKVYRCRIWREGNELKVRGYWGPFFRTQTWKRQS
jgi:uncharacterized protein (DUF2147 family)